MIGLFALDVDGTLTDGGLYLDGAGNEMKRFDIQDGLGLALVMRAGVEVALISGRFSPVTEHRSRELGIHHLYNGVSDKLSVLVGLASELGLGPQSVAYVGDDLPDLPCLEWAGVGIAVANARPEVLAAANWITRSKGGYGAVREAVDRVLFLNARDERKK